MRTAFDGEAADVRNDMVLPHNFMWQGFGTGDPMPNDSLGTAGDGSNMLNGSDMDIDLDAVFDQMGTTWSAQYDRW